MLFKTLLPALPFLTLVAAVPATTIETRASTPFIGTGIINVIDNGKSVGCLNAAMQWTPSTASCATYTGAQWEIPQPYGYPSVFYWNLTTSAGACGHVRHSAPEGEVTTGGYVISCSPSTLVPYWQLTNGVNANIGLTILMFGTYFTDRYDKLVGQPIPVGTGAVSLQAQVGATPPADSSAYVLTWTAK